MSTSVIEPGTRLAGRYRLEDRVSETGGSTLWKAIDEILARAVAVRTFSPNFPYIAEVVTAARAASRLTDPRLTQVFDADDSGELAYVVSEWVSGETLEDMVAGGGPLEPGRAASLLKEAADAITAAHAVGLAHLRLTPRTLLWTTGGTVKLLGLGVNAALRGVTAEDPALVDTRGLGHILYTALTGQTVAIDGTDTSGALPQGPTAGGAPCSPRQIQPAVPQALDAIVRRALDIDPPAGQEPLTTPSALARALAGVPRTPLPLFAAPAVTGPTAVVPPHPPHPAPDPAPGAASDSASGPASRSRRRPARSPAGDSVPPARRPGTGERATGPATTVPAALPSGPTTPAGHEGHGGFVHPGFEYADAEPGSDATAGQGAGRGGSHRVHGAGRAERPPVNRRLIALTAALAAIVVGVAGWQLTHIVGGPAPGRSTAPTSQAPPKSGKLTIASATGFDPTRPDHPDPTAQSTGKLAVDGSPRTAWHTQTYHSAEFGRLKGGLGVLLDMGRPVKVDNVRVTLPNGSGTLELRVGNEAELSALKVVATSSDTAEKIDLKPAEAAEGRYVLLWFTKLPAGLKAEVGDVDVLGSTG